MTGKRGVGGGRGVEGEEGGTDADTQNTHMEFNKNSMTSYIPTTTPAIKVNRCNKGSYYHQ